MKNYLVTIKLADGSNYETTIEAYAMFDAPQRAVEHIVDNDLPQGEIICILLSE